MRNPGKSKCVFLLALTAIALSTIERPVNATTSPQMAIANLGLLPGGTTSRATAINARGIIVGYGDTTNGENHAIRWNPDGRITDLGTLPGGTYSYGYGINNRGDIVGYANTADGDDHAVRWTPAGTITDLGSLPAQTTSYAYGINDKGSTVGYTPIRSKIYHATKWRPDGTISDLGTNSPLGSTSATAINNQAVVAGVTYEVSPAHYQEAVTWTATGTPVALPPLNGGGPRSSAQAINERGVVVGYSQSGPGFPTNYPIHAIAWTPGTSAPTDLGTLPGSGNSAANGVNDADAIVGTSATSTNREAVLWQREKNGWHVTPLPQLPGGADSEATAISNHGEVVGEASTASGQEVAVRWK